MIVEATSKIMPRQEVKPHGIEKVQQIVEPVDKEEEKKLYAYRVI